MSFDKKKFAQLLIKAQGKRTLNQFGLISKVDPGYLSNNNEVINNNTTKNKKGLGFPRLSKL